MDIVTGSQIYWLTRCDSIKEMLGWNPGWAAAFALCSIAALVLYVVQLFGDNECSISAFGDQTDEQMERTKSVMRYLSVRLAVVAATILSVCTAGSVASAFVPTTKEMAAITVVPRIANSQSVQDVGSGIVDLAKAWMEELSPKRTSKKGR